MQTLFFKKKNLEKKNNKLVNIFFINMLLITLLSMNIIPFISIKIVISIITILLITEGIIVKKVKINENTIKNIIEEINYLKEQNIEKNNYQNDEYVKSDINIINLNNQKNKIKVKKKI